MSREATLQDSVLLSTGSTPACRLWMDLLGGQESNILGFKAQGSGAFGSHDCMPTRNVGPCCSVAVESQNVTVFQPSALSQPEPARFTS